MTRPVARIAAFRDRQGNCACDGTGVCIDFDARHGHLCRHWSPLDGGSCSSQVVNLVFEAASEIVEYVDEAVLHVEPFYLLGPPEKGDFPPLSVVFERGKLTIIGIELTTGDDTGLVDFEIDTPL